MKKIDGYIEKYGDDYNMYFHYNGVEACFLYEHEEAKNFANYFSHKMSRNLPGVIYSDDHGWTKKEYDDSAVISSIKGVKNIDDDLSYFMTGCKNLDIEADFDIYFDNKKYEIVKDSEEDFDKLVELSDALNNTIDKDDVKKTL